MAEIWATVLGVERVGIDDNFFELGGDSILSIQVDREVPCGRHERHPARSLQVAHDRRPRQRSRSASPLPPPGPKASLGLGADDADPAMVLRAGPRGAEYWNQSFAFEVPADIDVDVLEEALRHVVSHHDALQLRFRNTGERGSRSTEARPPRSRSRGSTSRASRTSARAEAPSPRAAAGLQTRLRHRRTDRSFGPALPPRPMTSPAGCLLAIHHLAVDGVSWRILLEDLESAYLSLARAVR